jgi:phospholipid/cholesterol/gamma-HCH transport system ATP-binding protein
MNDTGVKIEIRGLTMAYGSYVVMRDINATVRRGSVFVIMGGSGCGKSTLLRHMIGIRRPAEGEILYDNCSFWSLDDDGRQLAVRKFGVLFQSGALWSSMTLAENVALPLTEYTDLSAADINDIVRLKLSLVGLKGFEDFYPAEIDPEILFFDEPSAGLDPISSRNLDDLILELRDSLGATIVVVSHELPSIFAIADDSIFLDAETKTARAHGNPKDLAQHSPDPKVRAFLTRGAPRASATNT